MENAEINNIIKIVGLQYKKNYEDRESLKSLRYGKIMIMTDQVRLTEIQNWEEKKCWDTEDRGECHLSAAVVPNFLYSSLSHSIFQWVITCFQIGRTEGGVTLPSCYLLFFCSLLIQSPSYIHSPQTCLFFLLTFSTQSVAASLELKVNGFN